MTLGRPEANYVDIYAKSLIITVSILPKISPLVIDARQ